MTMEAILSLSEASELF